MSESYRLPNKIFTQLGLTHPGYQTHCNKTQLYVDSIARLDMAGMRYLTQATKHTLSVERRPGWFISRHKI
jgi:hypothetical protein